MMKEFEEWLENIIKAMNDETMYPENQSYLNALYFVRNNYQRCKKELEDKLELSSRFSHKYKMDDIFYKKGWKDCDMAHANKSQEGLNKTTLPFEFERIREDYWRVKVFGGWIVSEDRDDCTPSNVFVSDARHEWVIE